MVTAVKSITEPEITFDEETGKYKVVVTDQGPDGQLTTRTIESEKKPTVRKVENPGPTDRKL